VCGNAVGESLVVTDTIVLAHADVPTGTLAVTKIRASINWRKDPVQGTGLILARTPTTLQNLHGLAGVTSLSNLLTVTTDAGDQVLPGGDFLKMNAASTVAFYQTDANGSRIKTKLKLRKGLLHVWHWQRKYPGLHDVYGLDPTATGGWAEKNTVVGLALDPVAESGAYVLRYKTLVKKATGAARKTIVK